MLSKQFIKRTFGTAIPVQPRLTQLLIDGKFVNSVSGKTFDTFNPSTEEKIISVQEADKHDVDKAVNAARKAFDEGPWRRMAASERGKIMYRFADLVEKHTDELANLEALDNGKPAAIAKIADIPLVVNTLRYYAGWTDKIHGKTIPVNGPYFAYTKEEPVGVCGQIIPWNFPAAMLAWKLGPALATGCTTVVKTAEQTPLSALRIGELAMEAGFPNGVINILSGYGPTAGQALAQHHLVDKVAFTGSTEVGYEIMKTAHKHNLKRITLELGGKSANIVMDDADIDFAIAQSQFALFFNQGQCCIAGSRLFVHEKIYDTFVNRAAELAKKTVIGNQFDPNTQQGPQVNQEQLTKILGFIESGKKEGAKLLTGGKRHGNKGFFVEPTIFADVQDNMTIAKEEIFGPVLSILKFKTVDEVIQRANNSAYGLGAGLVTNNMDNAIKISNGLRAGTVYVNCYDVFDAAAPFGGFKDSGLGRELGEAGLRNYLESKTVIIKRPDDSLP
ncbi:betaine-aldehyde dehydrogenase [Stylonychia lemnae]|uniref:Betaine-aldehyde dehydrogenase n=1 Tax=Stylonychia lemnae TaxID=5949 RepID=A0A078AAB9_STYLE|nr:betaine-aldehyde dehydrogenase [Stylonychia lemnae]|eukprot:CDW77748.1 betaine-aldehyde dehydrogenase [Stylonychia lemnae]